MKNLIKKLSRCHDLVIMAVLFMVLMNLLVAVLSYTKDPLCMQALTVIAVAALPVAGAGYLAWKGLRKSDEAEPDPYAALKNFPAHLEE